MRRTSYRAPVEEWAAPKTYVSDRPGDGSSLPSGDEPSGTPGSSPGSDRSRAKPEPFDSKENLERHPAGPGSYGGPGPASTGDNAKVPVRTVGTPGEEYGHPYRTEVYNRRTASPARVVREVFRDGDNLDPGEGARNLGLPGPGSPSLPYPEDERNRSPANSLNSLGPEETHAPATGGVSPRYLAGRTRR